MKKKKIAGETQLIIYTNNQSLKLVWKV